MAGRRTIGRILVLALVASPLAVLPWAGPAAAATTLVVDQSADEAPAPGNQCTAAPDDCSLRQAVDAAVDGDTIQIAQDIDPVIGLGEIDTDKDLTIAGQGATATVVDADHTSRIFEFATGSEVSLRDLTLREGQAPEGESGGAIRTRGPLVLERVQILSSRAGDGRDAIQPGPRGGDGGDGGGVQATTSLTIIDSTFRGNEAGDGGSTVGGTFPNGSPVTGSQGGSGGAVEFSGTEHSSLVVSGSTFADNAAGDAGAHTDGSLMTYAGSAGAIHAYWGASNEVVRSTFVGNRSGTTRSSLSQHQPRGGAIYMEFGPLRVTSSTFVRNDASGGAGMSGRGGAIATLKYLASDIVSLEASVLVDNVGRAGDQLGTCDGEFGVITGGADNIVFPADSSCPAGVTVADPWPDGDPPAPALSGGPTETVRLLAGSPAVDHIAAPGGVCEIGATTDQRGVARPVGAGCDAGAYELRPIDVRLFQPQSIVGIPVGGQAQWELRITSQLLVPTTNVAVQVTVPAGLSIVAATATGGSFDLSTGVWSVPDAGNFPRLFLTFARSAPGVLSIESEVIAADQPDVDSTPGNAATTDPPEDDELTTLVREPVDRWAVPVGTTADPDCLTEADGCSLEHAVETVALPGDTIHVSAGDYPLAGSLVLGSGNSLVGADPTDKPRLTGAITGAIVQLSTGGGHRRLSDLEIVNDDRSAILEQASTLPESSVQLDRVIVRQSALATGGTNVVILRSPAVLRDSIVHAGGNGSAILLGKDATLQNVTAVSRNGRAVDASTGPAAIVLQNVIARDLGSGVDVWAADQVTVTAQSSSYASVGGAGTITPPGTGGNQTAAPLFVDAANGDLHQAAGSPTIDAGTPTTSTLDVDGAARIMGSAIDIGADELVPADSTGPVIEPTIDPPMPASGWHRSNVSVSWSVTDPDGPVPSSSGCDTTTITAETPVAGNTLTCSATSAGGTTTQSVTIKLDRTRPLVQGVISPPEPADTGWYVTAPTVSFECTDPLSGIVQCTAPSVVGSAADVQHMAGSATDAAGNISGNVSVSLKVDLVHPTVVCPEGVTFTVGQQATVTASVSDEHSGAAAATVSAQADTSSVGTKSVQLTGTDVAGNTTTVSCSYAVSDASAPKVTPHVDPSAPPSGWHTGAVTVTWSVVDDESPVTHTEGCGQTTVSEDTTGLTLTCKATSAGGEGIGTVTVKRDATAPTITALVDPATPNAFGWRQAATVSFECDDVVSTVASCSVPVVLGSSAIAQSVTGTAVDVAGNTADATASGLLVDGVAPTIACDATPTFSVGEQGVVRGRVADAHSGPTGDSSVSGPADTTQAGTFSTILRAEDRAGNATSVPCPYVVQKTATVLDAHPVLLKLTGGVTVTFRLSARLTTAGGAPVAGQEVRFTAGNRVLCTGTTNTTGWASCGGTGAWTLALLNGGFTATSAGTAVYEPSTDTAGLLG